MYIIGQYVYVRVCVSVCLEIETPFLVHQLPVIQGSSHPFQGLGGGGQSLGIFFPIWK